MKLGNDCFISTLPTNIFPVDIALGIQEIKKGNNITIKEDEIETQGIIVGLSALGKTEESSLHPDIISRCSNSKVKEFIEMSVTKEQSQKLRDEKVIFVDPTPTRSNCELLVRIMKI